MPDWLTRILLGSARTPTYVTPAKADPNLTDDWHDAGQSPTSIL